MGTMAFGGSPYRPADPTPVSSGKAPAHRPASALKLRALLHRSSLDRQLAEGVAPGRSPALALRAEQLRSSQVRKALAATIEAVVADSERRDRAQRGSREFDYGQIHEAAPLLRDISHRLLAESPPPVSAIAAARRLLSDGSSPLYTGGWAMGPNQSGAVTRMAQGILPLFTERR